MISLKKSPPFKLTTHPLVKFTRSLSIRSISPGQIFLDTGRNRSIRVESHGLNTSTTLNHFTLDLAATTLKRALGSRLVVKSLQFIVKGDYCVLELLDLCFVFVLHSVHFKGYFIYFVFQVIFPIFKIFYLGLVVILALLYNFAALLKLGLEGLLFLE